jgi:RND family efflux transporter MFP subunit
VRHLTLRFIATILFALYATIAPGDEAPSVLVRTTPLQQGRVVETIAGYGTVAVDPNTTVTLSFPRPGRVSRLSVSAGKVVRQGEPMADFETDPTAVEAFRQATSALHFAREELSRTESMAAQKLATQSQLATALKAVTDAEATVTAQRRQGMDRRSQRLTAPFPGIVTAVSAKSGDTLTAGASILQLSRRGALVVVLGVVPEAAVRIKPGTTVRLSAIFDSGLSLTGKVREVHRLADPQTRLVDVVVTIRDRGGERLVLGSRLRGEIALGAVMGWLVPRSAVLRDERGDYLYQVDRGRARLVRVIAGLERGDQVEVRGKMDPRLRVVVVGNYELADGMAVHEEKP